MFAIISITHTAPPDEAAAPTAKHRADLKALHEKGKILAFGPLAPRVPAMGGERSEAVAWEQAP